MTPVRLLQVLLLLVVAAVVAYSFFGSDDAAVRYAAQLRQERRQKNLAFRAASSPLLPSQRAAFDSLRYFPPGDAWGVLTAPLHRTPQPDTIALPLSDGQTERYLRFGHVDLRPDDAPASQPPQRLTLFLKADGTDSTLFVPFTDLTNGHETYGGGRYLNVPRPPADVSTVELDFNRAYNPYCAYNDQYACPQPPAENRLRVAIRAGEKSFHD